MYWTKITFTCILLGIITESILYVNGQATDIRLGNVTGLELKPYEGPIEVFVDGEWGAITRHGVDNVTAKTVCKILGYGYTGFRVDKFQYNGKPKLSRVKCAGHETSILECQQEDTSLVGTLYDAPGVHCFDPVFTEVRLSGGEKATEGMVQVKMDGRWGRVCSYDQSSGTTPAPNVFLAICRTLGFQNYDLQNSFKGYDYDGVELSWLDLNYLSCTGAETHFNQCTFQDATIYQPRCYRNLVIACITTLSQYCSTDDICAGVENAFCSGNNICECKKGYIQNGPRQCSAVYTFRLFYTSEVYHEGLAEVGKNGQWSLITGGYLTFNDVTSKVLCQTLGFGFVGFSTWMYYYSEFAYNGYLAYKVFQCNGTETDATECFDNVWYQMGLSDGTPVTRLHCYDSRINDIRLAGGLVPHEGRLEVRIGEKWGTVCYTTAGSRFTSGDEVCKLLGYAGRGNLYPTRSSNEKLEVWLNGLSCEANVTDINDCTYDLGDALGGCSYRKDELDLYCSPLRLVDGTSKNSGRIEAGFNGKLQTICADDFSTTTANVSCKLLGYSDVVDVTAVPEPFDGEIKMLNSTVECNGTETSLEHCNISISSNFICKGGRAAGVTCLSPLGSYCHFDETCAGVVHSTCENYYCTCKHGYMSSGDRNCSAKYKFRFIQDISNEGLIEVNINHTWALVTGSFVPFNDQTSRILCATLGYGYTGFSTVSITDMNLTYTGYVWSKMIECTGTESYATECIYGTWEAQQQTRRSYLTRLHCFEYLVTDLRLQGGVLPNEGRFEVNINGRWGTVCVNERAYGSVSEDDLCRLLGYIKESQDLVSMSSEDLGSSREVWMSYPRCNTTDNDINDCSIIKGVMEGCNSHTYDLQLKCDPVRIVDGITPNSGRIEAGIRGQLLSFCEAGIDMKVANITCNILGYNGAYALSSGGNNGSSVYRGRLECTGTESSLENCRAIDDTSMNCKETGVAYIICQGGPAKIIPFDKNPNEGVFVQYYMNEWRHIGTAISDTTAKTLCNILGFGLEGYSVVIYGKVNGGTDIFEFMSCDGIESDAAECASGLYQPPKCFDSRCYHPTFGAVALYCSDYRIDDISFKNGLSSWEGTVQVLVNGEWGHVCATEWDTTDTNIACRTRGFASGVSYQSVQIQNATVLIGHLQCTGSESHLNQCTYQKKGYYAHSESCSDIVYVTCASECRQGFYGEYCFPCECNTINTKSCDIVTGECFCAAGWLDSTCSSDIDECATFTNVCPGNNICMNIPGSYTCECELGFMEVEDICKECSAGNFGRNCSSTCICNTDNTIASPDGRKCDKTTGGCPCNDAWSGISCDNDVNECLNSTICQGQNTQCKNTLGGYECICLQGYERQNEEECIQVASSSDTMMLVIILSSVVGGLTLVIILFAICFCQYRRNNKGAADPMDKAVNGNSNQNVLATSIRSTVKEEEYDTLNDETDTIDANALQVTINKDDGYLDIDLVNRNDQAQCFENGVMPDQVNEYLDLNAVEQTLQGYDYPYKGFKLPERGYVDVDRVGRKLPEIPDNSSTNGKEGTKDPYSQLKHQKLPEHMYERMADDHGYMKPVSPENLTSPRP